MCKGCAVAIGVTAVVFLGVGMWMYQSKYSHEKQFLSGAPAGTLKTPEDKIMSARGEPAPAAQPYGCGSFMKDCVSGEVGGCEQYKQSCASADNSVRMTMARPGECDQFRRQCAMGEYASCDLYNRACLYEDN